MRSIPFILLAALSLNAQAQLWERADQRSELVQFEHALPVGGGRWAVIGRTGIGVGHMISVWNGDGTMAWEQIDQYFMGQDFGDVVQLPDSGLLHVGASDGCDFIGPESRVRRYATDGSVLWEMTIDPQFTGLVTMAAKGSIGHIALASQDSVYILDMDGNPVGGFQVPSGDLRKILWASDSTLFMVMGTELKLVDLQGDELATTVIGPNVMDMHWDGQQLFVLGNDSIRRFSPDLVPLGNDPMTGLDGNSRFVVSDSALYVNAISGLYQLAEDGTSLLLFPWPTLPNLTTTGCAVRNGTVLATGNTDISGRSTGIVRSLSMDGDAAQHDQDVEVLLQVDSAWTEYSGYPYYPWDRKAALTGFAVNHGPDTLRSVVLSMWVQVPYTYCNQPVNRIDTSGFALAPGDTLSLPFGAVDVQLGLQSDQAAGAGEICIVALAPDHLADRAPDDNTACSTVDYVLGVHELSHNSSLSLAPNPAINSCVVSGLASLGVSIRVTIMDLTGRVVAEQFNAASTNTMQLDISGLSPATYILSAEGVRGRAMTKLVIARP